MMENLNSNPQTLTLNLNFVSSVVHPKDGPAGGLPEFAVIGRSNVGKSSLINMLAGRKNLAKTSANPGKTRTINYYQEKDLGFYLVDLPGYGYAKLSKPEKAALERIIGGYISASRSLRCTLVLIDSRHEPLKQDLEFMEFMIASQKRFVIVFTKADKIPRSGQGRIKAMYLKRLQGIMPGFSPEVILTSSVSRMGKSELFEFLRTESSI